MQFDLESEVSGFSVETRPEETFSFPPYLNRVSDALAASPLNILNEEIFESFKQLIYFVPETRDSKKLSTIYFTLTKSLQAEVEIISAEGFEIQASEHKQVLNYYIYLVYIGVQHLITLFAAEDKSKSNKKSLDDVEKKKIGALNTILSSILTTLCELLSEQLSSILQSEQELVDFCDIVLKSAYSIMMSKETIREKTNRTSLVRLLCIVAKNYQQNGQVSHRLTMALPFSEHLADPIAEVIAISVKTYDNRNLLQDILNSLLTINDIGPNLAKNISLLLVKISELLDVENVHFINIFQEFQSSSPTIRAAVMICYGNCINSVSMSAELVQQYDEIIKSLIDSLETQLLDTYQIVRQRSFQALELIHSNERSHINFKQFRYHWLLLSIRHLEDKSSFVRKAAIGLLKCLICRHPYNIDGGKLSWKFYWENYVSCSEILRAHNNGVTFNFIRKNELEDGELNSVLEDDEKNNIIFEPVLGAIPDSDLDVMAELPKELVEIVLKRSYCRDACIFIKLLDKSFEIVATLLNSKVKSDSIAAIEYFTVGDAYGIESAKVGVKQMLNLIWKNGSNEDGNKVVEKLIDSYASMFLTPYEQETSQNKIIYVATSLMKLTYNCNMADLISLEKMVVELCKGKVVESSRKDKDLGKPQERTYWITPQVIDALWHSFMKYKHLKEKKGAVVMLSMIALHDYRVVYERIGILLKYGMDLDDMDYSISTFACIALRRIIPKKLPADYIYPDIHPAVIKLKQLLLIDTSDGDWYNLAEEALNTLYAIDPNADTSASEVLKQKAMCVFGDNEDGPVDKTIFLSQFLFLLGHIGLKTIIYLEKCEADFKRKKQEHENKKNDQDVELDLIGGTNEDEFTDAVQNIKEKELLYGPNSILAKFVPLLIEIITKPKRYNVNILQRQATLCFAKFMCISPRFCESHLGLYLSLMEKSQDSIVRSNLVLGLGDIAVCFSNIIDENKSALYSELQDSDLAVQRTCLMTVTFLILAGQIKVKGQLSQLAKLLVHEDKGLREMSKLFFQELATKDNAIYNGFIEMLSGLNLYIDDENPKENPFPLDKFKEVIKFVLPFINKDRQRNLLIKKLDARLKTCTKNQYIRFAFCLKELIRRDDMGTKKGSESEKTRYYREVLDKLNKNEEKS